MIKGKAVERRMSQFTNSATKILSYRQFPLLAGVDRHFSS